MLREKKTNIFQHYLKKPTLKRNFIQQNDYIDNKLNL